MHFSQLFSLAALATAVSADTLKWDAFYDNGANSLSSVSCSDGPNGLITRYHWSTLGDVHGFPNVASAAAVEGWNSANCGTCWKLTYQGNSINVVAIDHSGAGFVVGQNLMNSLTNGQASQGTVEITSAQVDASECGL